MSDRAEIKNTKYSRQLTEIENELEFYNKKFYSFNIAKIIKIRGIIEVDVIAEGLKYLQRRHPFLRANIINHKEQLHFYENIEQNIPLKIIKKNQDDLWQTILESELNCKIDSENNSLLRVTYIFSPENEISELIFVIHHAISDGISLFRLSDTFLEYCQQITAGKEIAITSLNLMPAIDSLLSIKYDWFFKSKKLFAIARLAFNQIVKQPYSFKSEKSLSIESQTTKSCHYSLSQFKTLQLIATCKKEKTTVTAALNAAILTAFQTNIFAPNESNNYINGITAVDLRKSIKSELVSPENLGYLVGATIITFSLKEINNFWELARDSKKRINYCLAEERRFESLFLSKERIKFVEQNKVFPASFLLSNLGIINLKERYGDLELLETRITTSFRSYTPLIICHFTTFRNQLNLTFTYTAPLISNQKIEQFLNCFISVIDKAIESN